VKLKDSSAQADAAKFRSTHWSIVFTAAQDQTPAGQAALAELYRSYWYPLYAHVRRRSYSPEDAQDLTQSWFPLRGRLAEWLKYKYWAITV
jgi:hypothetical protein